MNTARFWAVLFAVVATSSVFVPDARGQTNRNEVFVDDPRPLEAAVLSLIERHRITITYEDPLYEYANDVKDVTEQVRKGHSGSKVLIPAGGVLQASYEITRDTGQPVSVVDMINGIVEAKNANPAGGRFGVVQIGDAFHIVPLEGQDKNGVWVKRQSILDTPITIESDELSGYALIEAVLKQAGQASGANILGLAAERYTNTLFRYKGRIEASNEPARDVLMRLLHSISPRFTWLLNYDPSGRYYVFALAMTAAGPPAEVPVDLSRGPRPGDPTPTGVRLGEKK
jgi:hypothetical protein